MSKKIEISDRVLKALNLKVFDYSKCTPPENMKGIHFQAFCLIEGTDNFPSWYVIEWNGKEFDIEAEDDGVVLFWTYLHDPLIALWKDKKNANV